MALSHPARSFTPYADVNEALAELLAQVQSALGVHLLALYLSGSLALGDFDPNTSDIDLVAVTEGLLTSSQQEALRKLHERFEAGASPWAGKVEVVYVERAALRRPLAEATPYPQVEKDGGFFVAPLEDGWLTQATIVRAHGVALFGPNPKTLIAPVDVDAMRRSLAHIPEQWQQQARHDPSWIEWLSERANQAFVTLTLCRLLYTLETGAVASKPGAARWAQKTLPSRWAALIADAPSGQQNHGLISDIEVTETVALVEYTVAAFHKWSSAMPISSQGDTQSEVQSDIDFLLAHSMLAQAQELARHYIGRGELWRHPYAAAQPRAAAARASVWFTAYPASVITDEGQSVLAALGDDALWASLTELGVRGVHTGPMKQAGGLTGRTFTPTIDGNFDRISMEIDPHFGTESEFVAMSRTAARYGAIVIDDVIPGHTGKGADFRLAELRYGDYPGLYHMVAIDHAHWQFLPPVASGEDSVNLSPATVDSLKELGYIVGQLVRTIFYEPGVKETDWSATKVVTGADGVARRWVYLHYFKAGQPTLNWLDPTFAAPRLVMGDALHSLGVLGAAMLRLDANGFLGVERSTNDQTGGRAWSEGHPLSIIANQIIGGMVRKVGGFTFQELNLSVDDIAAMTHGGADLSYDFITRPAYHHALVTGDTEFLRLMLRTVHEFAIDPASLVHALQNHDELTLELVHFWQLHAQDRYGWQGKEWSGAALRDEIRRVMYERLSGDNAPYNLPFVTNGVASTTASVIAAALGLRDLHVLTEVEIAQIRQLHLLLAMYNAFQPGIFALSGWDLVGALPLDRDEVAHLMGDGDTRWIHRGAYDLVGSNPAAQFSAAGLPRARALYGPINTQLQEPTSFASQLRDLLAVRQRYQLYAARQLAIPDVQSPGLLVMVHELPEMRWTQVTAINFGPDPIDEVVRLEKVGAGSVLDMLTDVVVGEVTADGDLTVRLAGYSGKSYLID